MPVGASQVLEITPRPARWAALAAASATVSVIAQGSASPQDLFGFGGRSAAMGMSGPASAEGYEAVFGAPALLAETRVKGLTLGAAVARHSLRADSPPGRGGERTLSTDMMKTIYIGAALPLPFGGALRDRITFGVGFLDPSKFLVRAKILYPERFQYPIVAPRVQSVAVGLGIGARIGDRFYVGVGYEALAGVVGGILITVDSTGRVGARSDDQVVATYAPLASAAFDLDDHWRIGATFRGELSGRFVIEIKAQDLGVNLPDFNVAGLAQYDPAQIAAEVRWSSFGRSAGAAPIDASGWRIVAGALARRWSKWPGALEPTVLENKTYLPPPIDAHDTVSPRFGVERVFPITPGAGGRLRAGYAFEPSPLPEQTGAPNQLDSARHVVTGGFGLVLDDRVPVDLAVYGQLHVLAARTHTKGGDIDPEAPGTPTIRSGGTIAVFGLTAGVRF